MGDKSPQNKNKKKPKQQAAKAAASRPNVSPMPPKTAR